MTRKLGAMFVVALLVTAGITLSVLATDAEMYFSSDKGGTNRVTNIQEGNEVWIVVVDNDDADCPGPLGIVDLVDEEALPAVDQRDRTRCEVD